MRYRVARVSFAVLMVAGTAAADDRPVPRQPIGPPQLDFQMLPPQKTATLAADNIRIVNKGDQRLSLTYWDQSAWQPLSIDVQGTTEVACSKCAGTIIVVYHDGTQNQRVPLKAGGIYWIGWSSSRGAWLLTNPPN